MIAPHFEILVEEPSMEAFLAGFLPRLLGDRATFALHTHQGKPDLLSKLPGKLRAYRHWLPPGWRVVVLLDRDDDDCRALKHRLDATADAAGMAVPAGGRNPAWRVANRIVVEELEAWFFGDWTAVHAAFPGVPATVPAMAPYRYSDAIAGGTWQALERLLARAGHHREGLRKVEFASVMAERFDPDRCASPSFAAFRDLLVGAAVPSGAAAA